MPPSAISVAEVDGLTNSINCLHSLGSPNGASEPNKHRSGTSVRAVLTDRGVNAADKSRYAFPCSFAKAITSIQFEPPICPKITGTVGRVLLLGMVKSTHSPGRMSVYPFAVASATRRAGQSVGMV